MKTKLLYVAVAAVAMTALTASQAKATSVTYYLNVSSVSMGGHGPVGTAGTVTLDDVLDNDDINPNQTNVVDVLVTLNPGYDFVKTGAGQALAFNIFADHAISIEDITTGFSAGLTTGDNASPFGTFDYNVVCSGCGNGGSNPLHGPLTFDVLFSGITVDSFVANDLGFYFAADVIGPDATGKRVTGNMGARGPENPPVQINAVPEPASLMLLGTGLMFGARKLRRRS